MDSDSDRDSEQGDTYSDVDSIKAGSEEYVRNRHGIITGGDERQDLQTNKGEIMIIVKIIVKHGF